MTKINLFLLLLITLTTAQGMDTPEELHLKSDAEELTEVLSVKAYCFKNAAALMYKNYLTGNLSGDRGFKDAHGNTPIHMAIQTPLVLAELLLPAPLILVNKNENYQDEGGMLEKIFRKSDPFPRYSHQEHAQALQSITRTRIYCMLWCMKRSGIIIPKDVQKLLLGYMPIECVYGGFKTNRENVYIKFLEEGLNRMGEIMSLDPSNSILNKMSCILREKNNHGKTALDIAVISCKKAIKNKTHFNPEIIYVLDSRTWKTWLTKKS